MTDIHYRHATEQDIPALTEMVTSAYRGESSRAGWTTEADLLDGQRIDPELLRADIVREDSIIVIAEIGNVMQACAHTCKEGDAGYFGMFSVRPTQQGSGIGGKVLNECERLVREHWHLAKMCMTVIDIREELIQWYERRGYRRTGIKKPFPYGDARFGLPKRSDLRFEVLEKSL